MKLQLLLVPYDSGRREWRMGRGPSYLLRHGAGSGVRALGHDVDAEYVEPSGYRSANPPASTEIATSFSLYHEVAARVRAAREGGAFPVVLAGNCGVTIGAVASADGSAGVGVVWLDAHGDFNTPETTASGFLDGMALAVLTGRAWQALAGGIPGFTAVPEANVVLVGVRDLDPAEEIALEGSEIAIVRGASVRGAGLSSALTPALEALRERVGTVHLHIDVDVLDAAEARANAFAVTGGLTRRELIEVVTLVQQRFPIASACITAYDPAIDVDGAVPGVVAELLEALVATPTPRS